MNLTTPDVIVILACGVFAVRGAFKGFAWQLVRTLGLVMALWAATRWYQPVGSWIDERIEFVPGVVAPVVAWIGLVVGIFLVVGFLAHIARGAIRTANLTSSDRFLGFLLGAAMGLVFATVGFAIWGSFQEKEGLKDALRGSYSVRYMAITMRGVRVLFPEPIRENYGNALDSLDDVAPPQ